MIENRKTSVTYRGDGNTTVFPFAFAISSADNIHVAIYDTATEVATEITRDYFVDVAAKVVHYPGYAPGQTPAEHARPPKLPAGKNITIYRKTSVDQLTDLGKKYPLPYIEAMSDKATAIMQEHEEAIGRAVMVQHGSGIDPAELVHRIFETGAAVSDNLRAAQQSASAARQAAQDAKESENSASHAVALATNAKNTAEEHRRAAESAAGAAQTARTEAEQSRQEAGKSQTASAASETHVKAMEENITSMKQHIDGINVEVDKAESAAKSAQESAKNAAESAAAAQKAVGTYSKADLDKKFQELDQQNASKFVAKSGDTMTGALTVTALTATGKIKADGGVEGNASTASALSTNVLTFANGTKIWVE